MPKSLRACFVSPSRDKDQFYNPVVQRDGQTTDQDTGYDLEVWLKEPCIEFILVPVGTFLMGSKEDDPGRNTSATSEKIQEQVEISQPFYLGKYLVTQEQYKTITGENPSMFRWKSNPVEEISKTKAAKFAAALAEQTGAAFSLPSEAQWECACRAGTETRFSFGDDDAELGDYAWFRGNSDHKTHPVGEKKPNPWGFYDMHGNVAEWTSSQPPGSWPTRAITKSGAYQDGDVESFRCASRSDKGGGVGEPYLGLRLCINLP